MRNHVLQDICRLWLRVIVDISHPRGKGISRFLMSEKPLKVVLLGDTFVGKSSLVLRYVEGQFSEFQASTVGAAYVSKTTSVDGKAVKLEIWDTAGQERYRSLAPMYYRAALGAIVVFDMTKKETLDAARLWIEELRTKGEENLVIALVGNKSDRKEELQVTSAEGTAFAKELKASFYLECSAKSGFNVDFLFERLTREYLAVKKLDEEGEHNLDDEIKALHLSTSTRSRCCKG